MNTHRNAQQVTILHYATVDAKRPTHYAGRLILVDAEARKALVYAPDLPSRNPEAPAAPVWLPLGNVQPVPEPAAPTFSDLCDLAAAHSIRVQPSSRAGCFDLYWPAKPGDDKREPHAFAVSVRDAIETIRFNVEQDRAARD